MQVLINFFVTLIFTFQIVAADYYIPPNLFFSFKYRVVQFIDAKTDRYNFEFLTAPALGERPRITYTWDRKFTYQQDFFSFEPEPIERYSLRKYSKFAKVLYLNENVCEYLDLLGGFQENTYLLLSIPRQKSGKYLPECICTYVYDQDRTTEFYHGPLGEEIISLKNDCLLLEQDHVLLISLNQELNNHIQFLKDNLISLPNNNFFAKHNKNWLFSWKNDVILKRFTLQWSNDINFSDCQNILYFLQDGGHLIEFGSYTGDHYIFIKPYLHPDTHVHAFEPSHYYEIMLMIKFLYRLDYVIPFKQALHAQSNKSVEFLNLMSQGSTMYSSKTGYSNSHVTLVNTTNIDDYWATASLHNKIGMIRVDIEGGEWSSLLGASKFFATAELPIMFVEFHFNNFDYIEKDFYNFLKFAKHNLEIYLTEDCSKKFNIHSMGVSANYIPDPSYYETIVVAKYFTSEFENDICPKLKNYKIDIERKYSEDFRGFEKLPNGYFSIGNRINNQHLHDVLPSDKKILIFINVDDHFVITQSISSKRCHKAIIYFSDNELLDYARYTLFINGLDKKVSISYHSEVKEILTGASKITRSEGVALVGEANAKECKIIFQLENYVSIVPYSSCDNQYQDL